MSKKNNDTRLIVAPSDSDADMLYATRIFIGDPFIFLQQNGKRTLVLSDLEIDRAKKKAKADEFVMLSALEREVQGKAKQAPPYEKVLAHFLTKRGVKRALVPANFPLGYANEIKRRGITLETTNGLFWPAREKKTAEEIKLLERALENHGNGDETRNGNFESVEAGRGKKIEVGGQNSDVGNSARGNRQRDLARRWRADKHNRSWRGSGVRSARAGLRATESGFTDHSRHFPA